MKTEFRNINKSLVPYDQGEIEALMKQLMFKNGITDVKYEGSNVSQIASVISYAIATLNVNTAINLQETILPLASKRMNVLMGARQLGYEPRAITSYKYNLSVLPKYDESILIHETADPSSPMIVDIMDDNIIQSFTIEPYTEFKNGDNSYWYMGPAIVVKPDMGHTNASGPVLGFTNADITRQLQTPTGDLVTEIEVVEGKFTRGSSHQELNFDAIGYTNPEGDFKVRQDYLIPFKNIEEDGITVWLNYIDKNGTRITNERWTKSQQVLVDENLSYNKQKFVRMENIILGYPAVFFEYAGLGNGIRNKTQISVDILQSNGPAGKAVGSFSVVDTRGSEIFNVQDYKMTRQGNQEETSQEIKENAIVFNNTGNRAVTRLDYVALAKRNAQVKEADAWGGEEEVIKQKGEIWLSCVPYANRPFESRASVGSQVWEMQVGSLSTDPKDDSITSQGVPIKNARNWYLLDEQWIGTPKNPGIRDYLDNYKIMTMGLNLRDPLYIEFNYEMKIVKYDIQKNPEVTNRETFDVIDNYFINNLEQYEAEYLDSNFQRVVDSSLGVNSGINYSLITQGVIHKGMIDDYYHNLPASDAAAGDFIIVNLSWPYDNILPNGTGKPLDDTLLPRIDTTSFGGTKDLKVDYASLGKPGVLGDYREADIKLGTDTVGTYRVDLIQNNIELRFVVDAKFDVFSGGYAKFDIQYPPFDKAKVNMPLHKNMMPRLNTVKFSY